MTRHMIHLPVAVPELADALRFAYTFTRSLALVPAIKLPGASEHRSLPAGGIRAPLNTSERTNPQIGKSYSLAYSSAQARPSTSARSATPSPAPLAESTLPQQRPTAPAPQVDVLVLE